MMQNSSTWQNSSVLKFAGNDDPVQKMEETAQAAVLEAVDEGWVGPPFDPLQLASLRGIAVRPNASIPDARIFEKDGRFIVEYNPNKSTARVNFSIAHEIAHTFFEDCGEKVRNRAKTYEDDKNWQLEMLCNIGAAEILMPIGSILGRFDRPLSIEEIMESRKEFRVSTEAMLIRMAKVAKFPVIAFAASRVQDKAGERYRIDYSIPSSSWAFQRVDRLEFTHSDCFSDCIAIGRTSKALEHWAPSLPSLHVEAVGLPPYPGSRELRIAGFAYPADELPLLKSIIEYRHGDATIHNSSVPGAIVHIANDKARNWVNFGFAGALKKRFPEAATDFRDWVISGDNDFRLGGFRAFEQDESLSIVSLIAQSGYGQSAKPRIRYAALNEALERLSHHLESAGLSEVQMPRIGSGQAGGNWSVIEGIIFETLVLRGINVKVYDLPPR